MDYRTTLLPLCAALILSGCATMDDKTQSTGIGAVLGCAAGAALASLTHNDAGGGCAAGALVGGIVGYMKARSAEIEDAKRATEAATMVKDATVSPVETEMVKVVDTKANTTDTVAAFKSVSVDIPTSQINTPEGREALRKLEEYARKTANERGETIDMTVATAPGKEEAGTAGVTLMETMETSGKGKVRHKHVTDPRVQPNVQRITIEAKNQSRIET